MGDLRGCPPELKDHHEGNVVDQLGPLVGVLAIYTHQVWSLTHVYFPFDGDFGYGSDLVKRRGPSASQKALQPASRLAGRND